MDRAIAAIDGECHATTARPASLAGISSVRTGPRRAGSGQRGEEAGRRGERLSPASLVLPLLLITPALSPCRPPTTRHTQTKRTHFRHPALSPARDPPPPPPPPPLAPSLRREGKTRAQKNKRRAEGRTLLSLPSRRARAPHVSRPAAPAAIRARATYIQYPPGREPRWVGRRGHGCGKRTLHLFLALQTENGTKRNERLPVDGARAARRSPTAPTTAMGRRRGSRAFARARASRRRRGGRRASISRLFLPHSFCCPERARGER